jgi:UDP-N-acetyl-alpha-D-muramoyl-L-alanyl-L-glutamate epimerase
MTENAFVFESYAYDPAGGVLSLRYRFADGPRFEERLIFDFPARPLSPAAAVALDRVFRLVFLVSGVSYYKAMLPPVLRCEAFALDRETANFLQNFYEKGLAEFAFKNRIRLQGHFRFLSDPNPPAAPIACDLPRRSCVPVGGGKDSIVTLECLKRAGEPLVLFALGDAEPIAACIAQSGLPFIRVRRQLDPALFRLNEGGALNGHVPITGILSAVALAAAVLYGCDTIAMSNEHSASAPNLATADGEINHQFSKSLEFERRFAEYIAGHISPSLAYFSLLRPFSEIEIARRFAQYPEYFPIFRSCNTAFRQMAGRRSRVWCGDCPKCRFVFLALSPFLAKAELIAIFGHNLLDDATQGPGFAALCGFGEHKPFECVGEVAESAAVTAYLADHPDWRDDAVLRHMRDAFAALWPRDPGAFRELFEIRLPHRVPDGYLAMLDARR